MKGAGDFIAPDINLLPEEARPYAIAYNSAFDAYLKDLNRQIELLMSPEHAAVAVPKTTIDLGSAVVSGSSSEMSDSFDSMGLPNTFQTSSTGLEVALNYTGKGILQRLIGQTQSNAGTSTATSLLFKITIDDNVVYNAFALAANHKMVAAVGSIFRLDSPAIPTVVYGSLDDPNGLPFNKSCKIEVQSVTASQPVRCGWRVLKKL